MLQSRRLSTCSFPVCSRKYIVDVFSLLLCKTASFRSVCATDFGQTVLSHSQAERTLLYTLGFRLHFDHPHHLVPRLAADYNVERHFNATSGGHTYTLSQVPALPVSHHNSSPALTESVGSYTNVCRNICIWKGMANTVLLMRASDTTLCYDVITSGQLWTLYLST